MNNEGHEKSQKNTKKSLKTIAKEKNICYNTKVCECECVYPLRYTLLPLYFIRYAVVVPRLRNKFIVERFFNMPNIKSAKKRVKVIETKTLVNKMFKTNLKTVIKKFNAAVESGNKEEATAAYKLAVKKIDQAAARGAIHANKAARHKSQFTLKLNNM